MSITYPANPNNKNYLSISGVFTGTVDTEFQVQVKGSSSNEKWRWKYKGTELVVTGVTTTIATSTFDKTGHGLATGDLVVVSSFTYPSSPSSAPFQGVNGNASWYVIRTSANAFKLADSYSNAVNEVSVTLSGISQTSLTVKRSWTSWLDSSGSATTGDGTTIVVNTNYSLVQGVTVKFTRESAVKYTEGDLWHFTAVTILKLSETDSAFDFIESVDIANSRNLMAINATTGDVRVVENIDSDNPTPSNENIVNLGHHDKVFDMDFELKNKELYVARGPETSPMWLGYNKSEGILGRGEESKLRATKSMDILMSSSASADRQSYYKSIVLRGGGGALTKNAKYIVGLKNDEKKKVYIYDRIADRQYMLTVATRPTIIKKYQGFVDSNGYVDGFIVYRLSDKAENQQCIGYFDIFNFNSSASGTPEQIVNKVNTFQINCPVRTDNETEGTTDQPGLKSIHDFLIMSKKSLGHSGFSKATLGTEIELVISAGNENFIESQFRGTKKVIYSRVWKATAYYTYIETTANLIVEVNAWNDVTPKNIANMGGDEPLTVLTGHPTHFARPPGWYFIFQNLLPNSGTLGNTGSIFAESDAAYTLMSATGGLAPTDSSRAFLFYPAAGPGISRITWGIESLPNLHSLEHHGYDVNGENPSYGFTCEYTTAKSYSFGDAISSIVKRDNKYRYHPAPESDDATSYQSGATVGPVFLDGADNLTAEADLNSFSGNATTNNWNDIANLIRSQEAKFVKWATNVIPFGAEGQNLYKLLCHQVDYNSWNGNARDQLEASTNITADDNIDWLTSNPDNTIGSVNLESVPSSKPLFGINGRYNVITAGTKRQRKLLSYVRIGNRKYCTFRWSDETAAPASLMSTKGAHPLTDLFPSQWTGYSTAIPRNTYTNWNRTIDATTSPKGRQLTAQTDWKHGTVYYYDNTDSASDAANAVKIQNITGYGGDTDSYRLTDSNWMIPDSGFIGVGGGDASWFLNSDQSEFIYVVPFGSYSEENIYKLSPGGTSPATAFWTAAGDSFLVSAPTAVVSTKWSGQENLERVFYKCALVLDGYQETALLSQTGIGPNATIETHLTSTINIKDSFELPQRTTGVAIYRATSSTASSNSPTTLFRFLEEIPLRSFNYDEASDYWKYEFVDTGDAEGTYESINGISELIYNLHINYACNTQTNGYMFVGNCTHPEIEDAGNYIFRSQPGKYSIFDWSKDFVQLSFVPTSLKGFQGKLFAFGQNQLSVINPESMYIEDTIEGIGCIGPKAMLITDGGFMWADYKNIYMSTPKIKTLGDMILNIDNYGWLNIPDASKKTLRMGYDARRKAFLLFFTLTVNSAVEHRCWAYSIKKNRWDLWSTDAEVKDTSLMKDGSTLLLDKNNRLSKYLSDTSSRQSWEWNSKKLDLGNTMIDKKIRNLKVEGSNRANISIAYKVPENDSSWQTGTDISDKFTGTKNSAIKLATSDNNKLHWVKLKITGTNSGTQDVRAKAASVIYKPKRAK
tara:strand:- start:15508 stop:19977 length:4470 start_codon:yes stop_codon:yes gene_type:complete